MILSKTNRDGMIEKNMGLVHSCAHKFSGKGVEYDDLFQAGCVGLIQAIILKRSLDFHSRPMPCPSFSAKLNDFSVTAER